jgi:hypothetical protein
LNLLENNKKEMSYLYIFEKTSSSATLRQKPVSSHGSYPKNTTFCSDLNLPITTYDDQFLENNVNCVLNN